MIPKSVNPGIIRENAAMYEFSLDDENVPEIFYIIYYKIIVKALNSI